MKILLLSAYYLIFIVQLSFASEEKWYDLEEIYETYPQSSKSDAPRLCLKWAYKQVLKERRNTPCLKETQTVDMGPFEDALNVNLQNETDPTFKRYVSTCKEALNKDVNVALKASGLAYSVDATEDSNDPSSLVFSFDESLMPEGYYVMPNNYYGIDHPECSKTGLKALQITPLNFEDPVIFAIGGTEDQADWYADMHFGGPQIETHCFNRLLEDIRFNLKEGHKVLVTGHSLGGALAQVAGVLAQADNPYDLDTQVITFASFGPLTGLKYHKDYIDGKIKKEHVQRVLGVNYASYKDYVLVWGKQLTETRTIPTDEINCRIPTPGQTNPWQYWNEAIYNHRLESIQGFLDHAKVKEGHENTYNIHRSKNYDGGIETSFKKGASYCNLK